jgi:peptidoglycan/LPS O-acetylase OafA/YrhL
MFLLFFFPVAVFGPNPEYANAHAVEFGFYAYGLDFELPFSAMLGGLYAPLLKYTVIAVVLVCLATPFLSVLMYRNRARQVQLSRLTILLNAALTLAFFLLADFFAKETFSLVNYGAGIYVPLAAIVFLLLAVRFIKKDDKLVRSADRIR